MTGRSGTGKTEFLGRYVLSSEYPLVLVFDGQGELSQRWRINPVVDPELLLAAVEKRSRCRVVLFDPAWAFPGNLAGGFSFWSDWCFSISEAIEGPKLAVVDELQQLVDTYGISDSFCAMTETGRRAELDMAVATHSFNLVHNRLRNQLSEVVTFAQVDPRAIEKLEEIGFDPEELPRLPEGSYVSLDLLQWSFERGRLWS